MCHPRSCVLSSVMIARARSVLRRGAVWSVCHQCSVARWSEVFRGTRPPIRGADHVLFIFGLSQGSSEDGVVPKLTRAFLDFERLGKGRCVIRIVPLLSPSQLRQELVLCSQCATVHSNDRLPLEFDVLALHSTSACGRSLDVSVSSARRCLASWFQACVERFATPRHVTELIAQHGCKPRLVHVAPPRSPLRFNSAWTAFFDCGPDTWAYRMRFLLRGWSVPWLQRVARRRLHRNCACPPLHSTPSPGAWRLSPSRSLPTAAHDWSQVAHALVQ